MDAHKIAILKALILLVAVGFVASCSEEGEKEDILASASISAATGGVINIAPPHALAGAAIDIPPGALAEDTTISLRMAPSPSHAHVLGPAIDIKPDGLGFSLPASVTLVYNEADLPAETDENALFIAKTASDSSLAPLDNIVVDPQANTVTGETTSLSVFVIAIAAASLQTWYADRDGDGFSDGAYLVSPIQPTGYYLAADLISISGDANDHDASIAGLLPILYAASLIEPGDEDCRYGGLSLTSGIDANLNGLHDGDEMANIVHICADSPYVNGESVGANSGRRAPFVYSMPIKSREICSEGGEVFIAGKDGDGDGKLAFNEVGFVEPLCYYDDFNYRLLQTGTVDPDLLYRPEKERGNDSTLSLYDDGRKIKFKGLPYMAWQIPNDPSWSENPFANPTWEFLYQSLLWIWAPIYGYEKTGDQKYLDEAKHYIFSWIERNPVVVDGTIQWYDHSVTYRAAIISYVYHKYLKGYLIPIQRAKLVKSMAIHSYELVRLLKDPQYIGHNHNMFHAMALFSLAYALSDWVESSPWKALAKARISQLIDEMVDVEEGVSLEQAMSYHWAAIRLFESAISLVVSLSQSYDGSELEIIDRLLDFAALMALPDMTLAPIGDTNHNDNSSWNSLYSLYRRGYGSTISGFFLGDSDLEPENCYQFPSSGYAVFRPDYAKDFQLIFKASPTLFSHGHNDALSFILFDNGARILTDPGGPYIYQHPDRTYFLHAKAHNTIVVDGRNMLKGDSEFIDYSCNATYAFVRAAHAKYKDVKHTRSVLIVDNDIVVVYDTLDSQQNLEHKYDLLYHFDVGTALTYDGALLSAIASDISKARLEILGSNSLSYEEVSGEDASEWEGWVTPAYGIREAAPVSIFSQHGTDAWFATVLSTYAVEPKRYSIDYLKRDSSIVFEIRQPNARWTIEIPDYQGLPVVRVVEIAP